MAGSKKSKQIKQKEVPRVQAFFERGMIVRASDIKVGYIYNVIFDPVRDCEFDGKHLAVVLKKNNDKTTFIVMPLTSAQNGNGINKVHIGQVLSLPASLRSNDTYAVFNQIRTVTASRFISLKEGKKVIEAPFPQEKFYKLLVLAVKELVYSIDQDSKIRLLKTVYEQACVEKAKDIAYHILALEKSPDSNAVIIAELETQIREILLNIPYVLAQKYVVDGIESIFKRVLEN